MAKRNPIRLNILSDLHLSVRGMDLPQTEADIVVLAGDIARPAQAVGWALSLNKPVVYVAGNHEFYGSSIARTLGDLKQRCAGTPIHFLDQDEVVIDGIRFIGATLWTDFLLYGDGPGREQAMLEAQRLIRDFSRIESDADARQAFTPLDSVALYREHHAWLDARLNEPFAGTTVVVTHHAPSIRSVHPRFAGSLLNNSYMSNADSLMNRHRAALWIHGHTHDSFDYDVDGTRVVCNPRGYAKDNINENTCFDPGLIISIP